MEDYTTYCVEEMKWTGCTELAGYKTTTDDVTTMFWCTCISCGTKKTAYVKTGVFVEPTYENEMKMCLSNYYKLSNLLRSKM